MLEYENKGAESGLSRSDQIVSLNINSALTSGCDSILLKDTFQCLSMTEQVFRQKYTKIQMIGKGSEAIVYKYQNNDDKSYVAVKVISQPLGNEFEKQIKELDILRRLQKYEGIIPIKNYVLMVKELSFQLLIIMDIADTSLSDMIQQSRPLNKYFSNE